MPQYIRLSDRRYPLNEHDIRLAHRDISFPVPFSPTKDYAVVFPAPQPSHDPLTRMVREIAPVLTQKGHWEQRWEIVPRFSDYTDAQGALHTAEEQEAAAIADEQARRAEAIRSAIAAATQARLDQFAATRGYDNIKSAASYAGCSVSRFDIEGSYCRDAMAATWQRLFEIEAEVLKGVRPMPASYADIEAELPALAWPA